MLGPKGSVLGPVLFLLFINDLPLFVNESYVDFYADDTTVHAANKKQEVVEDRLQINSHRFNNWCFDNDLTIYLKKTSAKTGGTHQNLLNAESLQIFIENETTVNVDNQKLLGVIIDKNLTWDRQIDAVCLKVTRRITLLKMLSKYLD